MPRPLRGVLPIVHVPFLDDDRFDLDSLRREIDWICLLGASSVGTGMVSELLR